MAKAEQILETSSIYRGQAVEVDFEILSPNNLRFDVARAPKFLDTNVREEDLILPDEVRALVEVNIWTPIRNTAVCREHKIPLRRSSLLAGKYGVGKSLASQVTAKICKDNNWTFLYLRNLNQLAQALFFAKKYEPCVVFAEDINRVVSGDRDAEMDKIFNVVDGIDRKNDEVMMILTTNDLEDIHEGMLRPGRIDSVITITPPDAVAAAKLVKHYGRNIIDPAANLEHVGQMLDGQIPAIIREAVERSKLAAIGDTKPGETLVVRAKHLEVAAYQLLEHAKLLIPAPAPKPDVVLMGEAIGNILADAMRQRGLEGETHEVAPLAVTAVMDAAGRPNNGKHNIPPTPTT
jgi:transitional endoplasmic reticulum ATPase